MTLTRQLSAEGHDLTLIDNDLSALESSEERYDIMVVHGNCASMPVLRQAGILEADLLIAATGADAVVTACPLCKKGIARGNSMPVYDLAEIVAQAL